MSDHDPTYWTKLNALLCRTASPQPVFVDAGANCGDFTASLLDAYPASTVHAVEPNAELCAGLTRRFEGSNVHVWNIALHEREGSIDLQVHANPATSSVLPRPVNARRYFHSADRIVDIVPVRTLSLDGMADDAGIEHIHLLKLDTQGAELSILRGARRALQSAAIDVIYTEFFLVPHYENAAPLDVLWALLSTHGYVMYDLFKGPYGRNGQLRFGDAIFVSPQVRERYLDTFPDEA
jgi:FkbM family methyltransferase